MLLPEDNDSTVKLNLDLNGSQSTGLTSGDSQFSPSASNPIRVNFADPYQRPEVSVGSSRDPFQLDSDPFGERTVQYGLRIGKPYTQTDVLSLNVFGREMGYEQLNKTDAGRRLIEIAQNNRTGKRRGFLDALTDFSVSDLPFVGLFATVGKSISDAATVSDTLTKLQNGEAVSDDDLIKTRLYMAENEYRKNGTWGSTVGDIVRAAPGFMTEFLATGGAYSAARTALAGAGKGGIHFAMSRASKILTRELVDTGMKASAANSARLVDDVAASVLKHTMLDSKLYAGMALDEMTSLAKKRAAYEVAEWTARNTGGSVARGLNSFMQWGKTHMSRGLIDFGAWGTEEATVAFTSHSSVGRALADAVGSLTVEPFLKGSLMWAPNQFVAKPLIASVLGDGRAVSESELSLKTSALLTQNKELMQNARSYSLGIDLLEYVSENTGSGFGSLFRGIGLGIDKLGAKAAGKIGASYTPLLTPARQIIRADGVPVSVETEGVSIGSAIGNWVNKILGSRKEFAERVLADKTGVLYKDLGVTTEAERQAIRTAVLSGSTVGLRKDIVDKVGGDIDAYAKTLLEKAYNGEKEKLQFQTFAKFKMADWMAKKGISPSGVFNLYSQMGYDGIVGEMMEERYSDVVKGLFGWDERQQEEKGFWKNIVQATKNVYPGFDQLAAEAVGFAVPLVTRQVGMRLAAKAGGESKVSEARRVLSMLRDVTRTDEVVQMRKGTYQMAMDTAGRLAERDIADAEEKIRQAEASNENPDIVAGMKANLDQLRQNETRRKERVAKTLSVEDIAKKNADDLINVQILVGNQYGSAGYDRIPVLTSEQAGTTISARSAVVEYAPELARQLYEFQSIGENESSKWYRTMARKFIGFTTGIVTGDYSAMSDNVVEWHARDYGLSREVCSALKEGFSRELAHQRKLVDEEAKALAKRGASYAFSVPLHTKKGADGKEIVGLVERTSAAFAEQAERIMSAYLETHQFRTFTQERFRDQAIEQVAKTLGYEPTVERDENGNGTVAFYKVDTEGRFIDSTRMTIDDMEASNKGTVDQVQDNITYATVNRLTRGLSHAEDKRSKLLNLARLPANADGVSLATHESAMALIGQSGIVNVVRTDGSTPLRDLIAGSCAAKVNMNVVKYIASFDAADKVEDGRAFESVARAMGFSFDGSAKGLEKRNAKIFRLARTANAVDNGDKLFFVGSTAMGAFYDSRKNNGNAFTVEATRDQATGLYTVVRGRDLATGNRIQSTPMTAEQLTAYLVPLGYVPSSSRIVFTQAKAIEYDDMFTAIRDLNMAYEYEEALAKAGAIPHPMLIKDADGRYAYAEDQEESDRIYEETGIRRGIASDEVRRILFLASRWNPETEEATDIPENETVDTIKDAWTRAWHPERGFMTIGEKMLRARGVYNTNPFAVYAGEMRPYTSTVYTVAPNVIRTGGADIYVPIDASSGFDYTTSLINAHCMRAFASHGALLKDNLGDVTSPFVKDVAAVVEYYLTKDDVKEDKGLCDELVRFKQAYLKSCNRIVRRPSDGKYEVMQGRELTPASFTVLASQFALFRATSGDLTGEFSRATSLIAPAVYRLPSFVKFMDVVDLVLGGNGFLNELVASANKKSEELGSQRGIRGILAAVDGDPDALRKAFAASSLSKGTNYDKFVSDLVDEMERVKQSGVKTVDEKALREAASRQIRLGNENEGSALGEQERNRILEDHRREVSSVMSQLDEWKTKAEDFERELARQQENVRDVRRELSETRAEVMRLQAVIDDFNRANAGRTEDPEEIKMARQALASTMKRLAENVRAEVAAKDELRGSLKGGNAYSSETATQEALDTLGDQKPALSAMDQAILDAEDPFLTIGMSPFQEELPALFDETVDGSPMSIRWGAEAKEGREFTERQAKLAVNVIVRALSGSAVEPTEGSVVSMAAEMFPGMSVEDLDAVTEQFRMLDHFYTARGRTLADIDAVTGDLWAEDEKTEDGTSTENYNEKAVKEFESRELGDFLALASRASSETGRNFQAFVTNVRELNRWEKAYVDAQTGPHREESEAIKYLYDILNPRSDAKAETSADALAIFEHRLREFDAESDKVKRIVGTLLSKDANGNHVSRKGAFLLSYMLSLKHNDRGRFSKLISNSLMTTPTRINERSGEMERRERTNYRMSENIVTDSFASLVGKSREQLRELVKEIDRAFDGVKASETSEASDLTTLLTFKSSDSGTAGNEMAVIQQNGAKVAVKLAHIIGKESPLFSALSSPRMARHIANVIATEAHRPNRRTDLSLEDSPLRVIRKLVDSLSVRNYLGENGDMTGRTGIELVDIIRSTIDLMSKSGTGPVTRDEISANFTAAFTTGDPYLGSVTMAPNSSAVTSPLFTLMSVFDSSLPETVLRADFDPDHVDKTSSVAIASRGPIPVALRFMDKEFDRFCKVFFPNASEDVLSECRQDMTWPDPCRTPIFAKSLSKGLTAVGLLKACEKTFEGTTQTWFVPMYAGDHSSSVLVQLPASFKNSLYKTRTVKIAKDRVRVFNGVWNRSDVEADKDSVYLFGDNTDDRTNTHYVPSMTQAVIRGLPNAIGIDTKKDRGTSDGSYFTDADFDVFRKQVDSAVEAALSSGKDIVIPAGGIGTGKAQLDVRAPKLFSYLQSKLAELRALAKNDVKDAVGVPIPTTKFTVAATRVAELFGLELLGADAKRSALSSLECEGASLRGVKKMSPGGTPTYGENRVAVGMSLVDGFTDEEMKGLVLMSGYGAEQLSAMSKDPQSMFVKAHFMNTSGKGLSFIKALCAISGRGKFAEGTAMRTIMDWLEGQPSSDSDNCIFTDRDSLKVSYCADKSVVKAGEKAIIDQVFAAVKADVIAKKNGGRPFKEGDELKSVSYDAAQIDDLFHRTLVDPVTGEQKQAPEMDGIELADGTFAKVSELMPGIRIDTVPGLSGPMLAISFNEDGMVGYTVANVSHTSEEPDEAGRTPRNLEIDAFTMATALLRTNEAKVNRKMLHDLLNLFGDWSVFAAATVSDEDFKKAMRAASESVMELVRNGEDQNGQNVKEELVRMVNAQLRQNMNLPLNAIDAVLASGGAFNDVKSVRHDHTKSKMYRAMNEGSFWYSDSEARWRGVERAFAWCNCNMTDPSFRHTWFLVDENLDKLIATKGFEQYAEKRTSEGDRGKVEILEAIMTDLYAVDKAFAEGTMTAEQAPLRKKLRLAVAQLFVDQWGNLIADRNDTEGKSRVAEVMKISYCDLFRMDPKSGNMVFDRSAFRIDDEGGADRVTLDADGTRRIAMGGTVYGFPRTPSYNGKLVVVRAGLAASEAEFDEAAGGMASCGRDACTMPDPDTDEDEGCDHDGDKTKMYFLHAEDGWVFDNERIPGLDQAKAEDFRENRNGAREEYRASCNHLYAQKYVDADGHVREVREGDMTQHDNVFRGVSEKARKRISNRFVRAEIEMARGLPRLGTDGNRTVGGSRRRYLGSVTALGTKAFPTGKTEKNRILSNPAIPQGLLKDNDGNVRNLIAEARVQTVVTDGASDASEARASVVSIMKDLHFLWATGYFFGKDSIFNAGPNPVSFWNHIHRDDGVSNGTFDDMKEQICGRMGWRPGMIDVLFTDILRNRQDDGTRGRLPETDEEFGKIVEKLAAEMHTAGTARWWMNLATDKRRDIFNDRSNPVFDGHTMAPFVLGNQAGFISTTSVMDRFGIEPKRGGGFALNATAHPLAKSIYNAGGDLSVIVDAGRSRGKNAIAGYLMYLLENPSEENVREFVAWSSLYQKLRDGRDFVRSFNCLNVDVGNDIESGMRDKKTTDFRNFMYAEGDPNNARLRFPVEGDGVTESGFDIAPVLERMNLAMCAAYSVGDDLLTVAARGVLSSDRYDKNLAVLSRMHYTDEGGTDLTAKLVAESFLLDVTPAYGSNILRLQGGAQQAPYVLSAFNGGIPEVQGSSIRNGRELYKALRGIATGVVAGQNADPARSTESWIFGMRQGIEAMFDLMYRLATTSDEHRLGNSAFAFFREADDPKFSGVSKNGTREYGNLFGSASNLAVGLKRIIPMFRANSEKSVERIRQMVDDIIAGRSFAGQRKNSLSRYGIPDKVASFTLDIKTVESIMKWAKDRGSKPNMQNSPIPQWKNPSGSEAELYNRCYLVLTALNGMARELGTDAAKITPAMMFGQILPVYSVLTTRTVGAPNSSSSSILGLLPKRIYNQLSAVQVKNDRTNRPVVNAMVPLDFGPANAVTRMYRGNRVRGPIYPKMLGEAAGKVSLAAKRAQKDSLLMDSIAGIRDQIRGGEDREGWRENPDFRNTFDIFVGDTSLSDPNPSDGIVMDAVRAINATPESQVTDRTEPSAGEVVSGKEKPSPWAGRAETNVETARFARAIGALTGTWASVKYLGGNVFQLKGRLRGDVGEVVTEFDKDGNPKKIRQHEAVITFTVGDEMNVDDEETVTALAMSDHFASSFCASTRFTFKDKDGKTKPLTAERFMSLSLETRKAFVRKYQVGGATANKIAWTVDGKGVATLCGAVRLNGGKNGTKVYHEYFHAMMRFFDALGMFSEEDRKAFAREYNSRKGANRDTFTLETEERMAEAFRKWVDSNTEKGEDNPKSKNVHTIFQKIYRFLVGLLKAMKNYYSHSDAPADTIFKMAVHGIAHTTESRREEIGQALADIGAASPVDIVTAAEIGKYTSDRLRDGSVYVDPHYFTMARVKELMPSTASDKEISEKYENVRRAVMFMDQGKKVPEKYSKALNDLKRLALRDYQSKMAEQLDRVMSRPNVGKDVIQEEFIDTSYDIPAAQFDYADALESKMVDLLRSNTASEDQIQAVLDDLVPLRGQMAESGGYEFSIGLDQRYEDAPNYEVVPGETEFAEAEIRAAVDAGTSGGTADRNVASRAGDLIMKSLTDGLISGGAWAEQLTDTFARLGDWTPSEASLENDIALSTVRAVLADVNPDFEKNAKTEDLEKSLVFEALLRVHAKIDSIYGKDSGSCVDPQFKEAASRWDLAAFLLSTRYRQPGAILDKALKRMNEIAETLGGSGKGEVTHLVNAFTYARRLLSDPTGLAAYTRGMSQTVFNRLFEEIRRGLIPVDADPNDESTWRYFDADGRMKDLMPLPMSRAENMNVATHIGFLNGCYKDAPVQEALKLAIRTAYELASMAKFMNELNDTPPNATDIELNNGLAKRSWYRNYTKDGDWFASMQLSSSAFADNHNLVEHFDQSYFIANNIDQWLSSMVRKTFGAEDIGEMLQAEHREFGGLMSEILNLENFYSFLTGTNVEANGEILKLIEQDRDYKMEFGEVVRKLNGKSIKFDNYHNVGSGVKLTFDDIQTIDLFWKMLTAYAKRQRGMVTGVDKLTFDAGMSALESDYDERKILDKEAALKAGEHLNSFEEACWRMIQQLPKSVRHGEINLYGRFVKAACQAIRDAKAYKVTVDARTGTRTDDSEREQNFDFNTFVLRALEREGLAIGHRGTKKVHDGLVELTDGVVTLGVEDYHDFWLNSEAYRKLRSAGRTKEMLDRDSIRNEFMSLYHKTARFARQHAWVTEGDGKFLNMFGTELPFFRGTGVFMYGCNRRDRSEKRSYVKNLPKYENTFYSSVNGTKSRETIANNGDVADLMAFLHDMYDTPETGVKLRDAIADGKYTRGPRNKTDLVLEPTCTRGDVADRIYTRLLERADREEAGLPPRKGIGASTAEDFIRIYRENRGEESDMFGGMVGMNDEMVFRMYGSLPTNDQLGHAVHKAMDGITNAIMQRNVMVNMLLTPNADGQPVYFANPDKLAVDASGLPDSFWQTLSRWWSECIGRKYDDAMSGVDNARAAFETIRAAVNSDKSRKLTLRPGLGAGDQDKDTRFHRYTEFPQNESDLASVTDWLVMDDEELGGDSSYFNALSGGEAMGYLRQFLQASRVLGFGGAKTRASLHRCLSWSKTLSVSFSFFFPLATKWESPIGAVGALSTLASNRRMAGNFVRENPEVFNAIQKMFGGSGWITKDFLGFTDVLDMMDSNDPFLAELISWAEALGVKISDRFVNPVEPTRGLVDADLNTLKRAVEERMGHEAAAKFGRVTKALFSRSSERSFSYALNATKLATVAQLCMKLRHEAAKRGKAFDPVRDLSRYSGYLNAEIGGIDPLKYAWATPRFRGFMNVLMFSWEWTRGAWEAGGGNVLEDVFFGGHSVTPEERDFFMGRWARMFGTVMVGVPAMIQMLSWGAASLAAATPWLWGTGDDDDKLKKLDEIRKYLRESSPFTWRNEEKTRWTAADLTPLLKVIEAWDDITLGGALRSFKENGGPFAGAVGAIYGAALGGAGGDRGKLLTGAIGGAVGGAVGAATPGLIPMYTGMDSANRKTRNRRLYLHFGKQGWEFFRWFDAPRQQMMSKLSMPAQRMLEGAFGRNLGYLDRGLPWEDKGALERWFDPSFDGALWNLASAFLPFSVGGIVRTGDAGALPVFGPVQYGASYTAINERIVERLEAFAMNDRKFYSNAFRRKSKKQVWMTSMLSDIIADARSNGVPEADVQSLITNAAGQVAGKLYGKLWEAIPEDPSKPFDAAEINSIARSLNRLGTKVSGMTDSLKKHLTSTHRDWDKVLSPKQKAMYKAVIRQISERPYSDTSVEETIKSFDY